MPFFYHNCYSLCSGRKAFGLMCNLTKEPEDVTVGLVVGEQQIEICDILYS